MDKETTLETAEFFTSINGEGILAGQLATFVRFRGCNLRCSYCDTQWANNEDTPFTAMTPRQICDRIDAAGVYNVTLTGGEPLLQKNIGSLIEMLMSRGRHHIEVETNGSIDITPFDAIRRKRRYSKKLLAFTLDYKLAGSRMEKHMLTSNYDLLLPQDAVKFVVSDTKDLEKAKKIIEKYDLTERCSVFLSPVFGKIEPAVIVDFMKNNFMNGVRVQIQLHKIIWNPAMRGV